MSGEFRFETFVDTHSNIFNEYFTEILYLFLDYPHKYYVFKYFEV